MQPIPTVYNGTQFRSKTEAHWSLFFNTLNLPYHYEPEGFDLGDRLWYLPDFYLPQGAKLYNAPANQLAALPNLYVEVKPSGDLSTEERTKIRRFVQQSQTYILLINGLCDPKTSLHLIYYNPASATVLQKPVCIAKPFNGQLGLVHLLNDKVPPDYLLLADAQNIKFAFNAARNAKLCDQCHVLFVPTRSIAKLCATCASLPPAEPPLLPPPPNEDPQDRSAPFPWRMAAIFVICVLASLYLYYPTLPVQSVSRFLSTSVSKSASLNISTTCPHGCTTPPPQCTIKGNISATNGAKIYKRSDHLPGQKYYQQTISAATATPPKANAGSAPKPKPKPTAGANHPNNHCPPSLLSVF